MFHWTFPCGDSSITFHNLIIAQKRKARLQLPDRLLAQAGLSENVRYHWLRCDGFWRFLTLHCRRSRERWNHRTACSLEFGDPVLRAHQFADGCQFQFRLFKWNSGPPVPALAIGRNRFGFRGFAPNMRFLPVCILNLRVLTSVTPLNRILRCGARISLPGRAKERKLMKISIDGQITIGLHERLENE